MVARLLLLPRAVNFHNVFNDVDDGGNGARILLGYSKGFHGGHMELR